jgi:hypothetical protein
MNSHHITQAARAVRHTLTKPRRLVKPTFHGAVHKTDKLSHLTYLGYEAFVDGHGVLAICSAILFVTAIISILFTEHDVAAPVPAESPDFAAFNLASFTFPVDEMTQE